jgi:hypothetical protein
LPIKRGEVQEKGGRKKRGIERREPREKKEKKEQEEKKKQKKIGEETVRTIITGTSTVASSCVLPPPLPPAAP